MSLATAATYRTKFENHTSIDNEYFTLTEQ